MNIKFFPLFLAYMLYPIVMIAARHADVGLTRSWIDLVWMMLAFVAIILLVIKSEKKLESLTISFELLILALLAIVVAFKWVGAWYGHDIELIPYFMELKPVVYLYISIIWFIAVGKIDSSIFVRYGAFLGVIVIFDFILESLLAGQFSLPRVSGERNYDACLLLISYVMTLSDNKPFMSNYKLLIFLGLILTFSRTALGAALIITLFASDIRLRFKIITVIVISIFMVSSFLMRDLPLNSLESMDRYWMWSSTINLLINHPSNILFGFPVGVSLPMSAPPFLESHWYNQSAAWGIEGIYPFHMHAFWLRIVISWGLPVAILMLFAIGLVAMRHNMAARGLCLLLLVEGLAMGVFYLSNVAIPLFIAFLSVLNNKSHPICRVDLKSAG